MDSSAISTKDQHQALLEILKEMSSVFWGPDLKKCTEILQKPILGAFDQLPPNIARTEWTSTQLNLQRKEYNGHIDPLQTQRLASHSAENADKKALIEALRQTNGNQTQAARLLGINCVTVWNRMKKYNIDLKKVLSFKPGRNEGA